MYIHSEILKLTVNLNNPKGLSGRLTSGAERGERKVNNANSTEAASTRVQKTKQNKTSMFKRKLIFLDLKHSLEQCIFTKLALAAPRQHSQEKGQGMEENNP